jgi:hypothetical protein
LARTAFPHYSYFDLEDPRTAERFQDDPRFVLDQAGERGMILDEAQAVPSVFAALRGAVDAQRAANGRFILRGGGGRELRVLRDALSDIDAKTAWVVDQADGIELLSARVARAGFAEVIRGTP